MIDLQELHAAGAEVAGLHGDAWLRMPALRNERSGIIGRIRELHAATGRRVIPGDLTGQPLPACVTGETVGQTSGAERQTPGAILQQHTRPLTADEIAALQAMVTVSGSRTTVADLMGLKPQAIDRALRGRALRGDHISAIVNGLVLTQNQAETPAAGDDGGTAMEALRDRVAVVAPPAGDDLYLGAEPGTLTTAPCVAEPTDPEPPPPPVAEEPPAIEPEPTQEPVMQKKSKATKPKKQPHPILARIMAAAAQRGLTRRQMIEQLGVSTCTIFNMQHGHAGERVLDKCEAWLNGQAVPNDSATIVPPKKRGTSKNGTTPSVEILKRASIDGIPYLNPAFADPSEPAQAIIKLIGDDKKTSFKDFMQQTLGDLLRQFAGVEARQVFIIEDGKLVERQAVLL